MTEIPFLTMFRPFTLSKIKNSSASNYTVTSNVRLSWAIPVSLSTMFLNLL